MVGGLDEEGREEWRKGEREEGRRVEGYIAGKVGEPVERLYLLTHPLAHPYEERIRLEQAGRGWG